MYFKTDTINHLYRLNKIVKVGNDQEMEQLERTSHSRKVQEGKDQEKAQSEKRFQLQKPRWEKNQTNNQVRKRDQFDYKGTLGFLVYREGNVDTFVTNDMSISQLGIEILRSEKQSKLTSCRPILFSMSP